MEFDIKNLIGVLFVGIMSMIFVGIVVSVGASGSKEIDMYNITNLVLNTSQNGTHIIYSGVLDDLAAFQSSTVRIYYSVNSLDTSNRTIRVYNNGTLLGNFTATKSPDGTTIRTTTGYYDLSRYTGNLVNITYEAPVNAENDVNCTSSRLLIYKYNQSNNVIFGAICVLMALFAVAYAGKGFE